MAACIINVEMKNEKKGFFLVCERIRKRVEEFYFGYNVTISGGVSSNYSDGLTEFIDKAGKKLCKEKNLYCIFITD